MFNLFQVTLSEPLSRINVPLLSNQYKTFFNGEMTMSSFRCLLQDWDLIRQPHGIEPGLVLPKEHHGCRKPPSTSWAVLMESIEGP